MLTIGQVDGVSNFNIVVKGTGNPAVDHAKVADAVSRLNNFGKGTLWIDGNVAISGVQVFTSAVSLRGLDNNAKVTMAGTGTFYFGWNSSFNILSQTAYNISAQAKRGFIDTSGTGYTPVSGEWVCVWSEDVITGVEPHGNIYSPRPMEVHQIAQWNQLTGRVFLNDFIVDSLTTSGKLARLPMLNDIKVDNLIFSRSGTPVDFSKALQFRTCNNLQISNLRQERNGGGELLFHYCSNVKVSNLVTEGASSDNASYNLTVGAVNSFIFENSIIAGTRHVTTTTSSLTASSPLRRYGTPLNVKFNNVVAHCYPSVSPTGVTQSRVAFDSHPEGWGIEYNNCTAIVTAGEGIVGYGFQTRSRYTTFNNCRVLSNGLDGYLPAAYGIGILADDAIVKSCIINGCWRPIRIFEAYGGDVAGHNVLIDGVVVTNSSGPAVWCQSNTNNHKIINSYFFNCAHLNKTDGIIKIDGGTGHIVCNNHLMRESNAVSINRGSLTTSNVSIVNNIISGYNTSSGTIPLGINPSPSGELFEQVYLTRNHTDTGIVSRKEGQDAHGNISGVITVDFDNYKYDNVSFVINNNWTPTFDATRPGNYNVIVSQDAVGGRTITWANTSWLSAPQPATGVFDVSLFNLYFDGSDWRGLSYHNIG